MFSIFPHLLPDFYAPGSYLSELPMPILNHSKVVQLIMWQAKGCCILSGTSRKLCWPHILRQPRRRGGSLLASHNLFTWYHVLQREIWECDGKKMRPGDLSFSLFSASNELCRSDEVILPLHWASAASIVKWDYWNGTGISNLAFHHRWPFKNWT